MVFFFPVEQRTPVLTVFVDIVLVFLYILYVQCSSYFIVLKET